MMPDNQVVGVCAAIPSGLVVYRRFRFRWLATEARRWG